MNKTQIRTLSRMMLEKNDTLFFDSEGDRWCVVDYCETLGLETNNTYVAISVYKDDCIIHFSNSFDEIRIWARNSLFEDFVNIETNKYYSKHRKKLEFELYNG